MVWFCVDCWFVQNRKTLCLNSGLEFITKIYRTHLNMSHAHTASSSSSNKNSAHTVTAMIKKFSKSIGAFRSSRLKKWSKGGFIKELASKVKNNKENLEKEQKVRVIKLVSISLPACHRWHPASGKWKVPKHNLVVPTLVPENKYWYCTTN